MESVGLAVAPTPEATGSQRAITPAPPPPSAASEAACAAERAELQQLRVHPDRRATISFAAALRCKTLEPQVARLLESLDD